MPIHPTAVVDPRAQIDPSVEIGPYVVIEGEVQIGADCRVGPFTHVLGNTVIEANCVIHSGVAIGDLPQDKGYMGGESYCRIGAGTTIREGATIHRGTAPGSMTSVGAGCLIMCNAHVGHNCRVGEGVVLVNGALLAGFVEVGRLCIISGNSAVHQQVRIGELTIVGGLSKVTQDIPPFMTVAHDRGCVGVNVIGLRRNGMSEIERVEARQAYKILYRSGLGLQAAIETLEHTVETRTGIAFLEFLRVHSNRGLISAPSRMTVAEPQID